MYPNPICLTTEATTYLFRNFILQSTTQQAAKLFLLAEDLRFVPRARSSHDDECKESNEGVKPGGEGGEGEGEGGLG